MNTKEIIDNRGNISLVGVDTAKTEFCSIWPNVKSGLEVLQNLLKNPVAKGAVGLVIAAGDAVSKQICG
ncbi:hypothetical protein [Mucilaginibacter sp. UR6-11]|uniref:hypothetical protein n=1 Tax=Mucilaginibacter sp. UR6-11 TaxID=1435644 RepID=UPI001E603B81|nr:hypothetical protein [Mucilaginibacter sp. UR6-11]MCC8424456.1 hypothetical protein [Mucilaginibacter sp. UR6-11]